MKRRYSILFWALSLCSCSSYQPLKDKDLYPSPRVAASGAGVKVTFLGNSTILLSDGSTHLLVDGFFSRPHAVQVALDNIGPDMCIIRRQLELAGIRNLHALLVGHSHYDHALDAPEVAAETGAVVVGSESYAYIHARAEPTVRKRLIIVPQKGKAVPFGEFVVTFRFSKHIRPHLPLQGQMQGPITADVGSSARATDYDCGDVFALHIKHRQHGSIAITTTADARKGQFHGLKADVVMPAVGLLVKEPRWKQEFYWRETVEKLCPSTIIPVHWDNFTRKLDENRVVRRNLLAPRLKYLDDTRQAMTFVKKRARGRHVWVMGLRDSFLLRDGKIRLARGGGEREAIGGN